MPTADWRLTTFSADVTIPIGHACMAGGIAPASSIVDPLEAIGFILEGGDLDGPVVLVAVDWCEIRNEAYDAWRDALADVAGTDRRHVLVTSVHQHDAPVMDPAAQRLLDAAGAGAQVCDPAFNATAVDRVAAAARAALDHRRRVTGLGIGRARVDGVASNRRYVRPDGSVSYHRTSASDDPDAHTADAGLIDPWLTTISLWDGDEALLALSHYAVHPMSYYGQGGVSADFVGHARRARQRSLPGVHQVYVSGCSGNVTAGKHNDGAPANRPVLAGRMETAMANAWETTVRTALGGGAFRSTELAFEPRGGAGYAEPELEQTIAGGPTPYSRCLAAMGLSWRGRVASGEPIDLPVLDLGAAVVALLPGEAYVEYQLLAQALRPEAAVVAIGYGECATGYIPTATQLAEGDENLGDWYWVSSGAEAELRAGLERVLPVTPAGAVAQASIGSP